jgi:diacylglycerol kinase (ATP)
VRDQRLAGASWFGFGGRGRSPRCTPVTFRFTRPREPPLTPRVRIIANPAAGRGLGARRLPAARAAFDAITTDVALTAAPGDEGRLVRGALDDGCTTIAVLGGDGTWSNVARALLAAGAGGRCALALLAAGTGSDYAKSVGAPAHDFAATAALVAAGAVATVDAGRVDDEPFINVAGFGFDAAVVEYMAGVPWLRGDALYLYSALRQLFGYRGFGAEVRSGEGDVPAAPRRETLALVAANGRHFGGTFLIAPNAAMDDGRLDFVEVGPAGALRRAAIFAASTRGRHVRMPEVRERRARSVVVRFDSPPAYEADGELRRAAGRDVRIACLPRALRVVTGGLVATSAGAPGVSAPDA